MTSPALALSRSRSVQDVLLAGLAGAAAPHLVALGWAALSAAAWERGLRLAVFLDPAAAPPVGYVAASVLFNMAAGVLLGAGLARTLDCRARAAGACGRRSRQAPPCRSSRGGTRALAQPVVVLFIASSAQAFRLRAAR